MEEIQSKTLAEKLAEAQKQVEEVKEEDDIILEEPAKTDNNFQDVTKGEGQKASIEVRETGIIAPYTPKAGDVKNGIRYPHAILANGTVVKPNKAGYFVQPEGELLEILKYFVSKGVCTLVK